jgi:hypothetical protein
MPVIGDAELKRDTEILSSDAFGGRLPGTPGGDRTVAYMIAGMRTAGLQPGNHGRWTQDVPLVTITADPHFALDVAGKGHDEKFVQNADIVLWTKRHDGHGLLANSSIIFAGYGIHAPERGWDDYAGVDVHGKTVIVLVNDPDWQSAADTGTFGGRRLTYYGRWTYRFEEARRQRAAAAIIIHDTAPAGYPFGVLVNTNGGPKIDLDLPSKGADHAAVEGWISTPAAQRLFRAADLDLSALIDQAGRPGFRAFPIPLTANVDFHSMVTFSRSQNVVGLLPGTTRRNETFLYSAHWDHIGHCPANASGHAICNGAIDNASGSAALLALARIFAKEPRHERSILFLSLTGEEQGLLGSSYYVSSPDPPSRQHSGRDQHGRHERLRTDPRCYHPRSGTFDDRTCLHRSRPPTGQAPHTGIRAAAGPVLPIRSTQLRACRRADAVCQQRQRRRYERSRRQASCAARLFRAHLSHRIRRL